MYYCEALFSFPPTNRFFFFSSLTWKRVSAIELKYMFYIERGITALILLCVCVCFVYLRACCTSGLFYLDQYCY